VIAKADNAQLTRSPLAVAVRLLSAVGYLLIASFMGALVGSLPLPLPDQLVGSAPWVTDVSPQLLAVMLAMGLLLTLLSLGWLRRWAPGLPRFAGVGLAAGLIAMTFVAAWSALYAASLAGEAVIPLANWTWPAAAMAASAGVVGSQYGVWAGLAAGCIGVAPVVALDAFGWAMYGGEATEGIEYTMFLDGFGIAIGSLFALLGAGRKRNVQPD
jgi:hypothetical protein